MQTQENSTTANNSNCTANIKEQVIISIIKDEVIFSRISASMRGIVNAVNPNACEFDFEPYTEYNGMFNALDLMGITNVEDGHLRDALREEFTEQVHDIHIDLDAKKVAYSIYISWLKMISEYFTNKKTA